MNQSEIFVDRIPPSHVNTNDGRIPIRIGIVGHRLVGDPDRIKGLITDFIWKLQYDLVPDTPLIGVTALADGADRIAAKIFIDLNIPLLVPLPLPIEIYKTDFSVDSQLEVLSLLSNPLVTSFQIPYIPGNNAANTAVEGRNRDLQYASAGLEVSQRSHILMAIWDGDDVDALGGTSWLIRERRNQSHSALVRDKEEWGALFGEQSLIDNKQHRRTYLIPVNRESIKRPLPGAPHWVGDGAMDDPSDPLMLLNQYNSRVLESHVQSLTEFKTSARSQRSDGFSATAAHASLQAQFQVSDSLASDEIQNERRITVATFLLAGTMAALLTFFAEFHIWQLLVGYLAVALVIAWSLHSLRKNQRTDFSKQYRALAEGLRVQIFWSKLGISETVARHYLQRHRGEISWVLSALVGASPPPPPRPDLEVWGHTFFGWCDSQIVYFSKRVDANRRRSSVLDKATRLFFTLALALTGLNLLWLLALKNGEVPIQSVLSLLTSLSFLIAGLVRGFTETRLAREDETQYERMLNLFSEARLSCQNLIEDHNATQNQDLRVDHSPPNVDLIYRLLESTAIRVGKEALREHADWTTFHIIHAPRMPST